MRRAIALIAMACASAQTSTRPSDAEVAAARARAADLLRPVLLETAGAEVGPLVERLARAAAAPGLSAGERYVLLEESLRCARAGGDLDAAFAAGDRLAERCGADRAALRLETIAQRRARDPRPLPLVHALLATAGDLAESLQDGGMRKALAVAAEVVQESRDEPLARWLAREREGVLARHMAWRDVAGDPDTKKRARYECLYKGEWGLERVLLGDITMLRFVTFGPADDPVQRAERLLGLAGTDAQLLAVRNLRRRVREAYGLAWVGGDAEEHERLLPRIEALVDQIGPEPGLGELRFSGSAPPPSLVLQGGEWRVEGGLLLGRNSGRAARATLGHAWRRIDCVTVRGGIRSKDNLNFRIAIDPFNALLNWEVADESHFYLGADRVFTGPPLLERGREHVIRVHQLGEQVCVAVDGKLVCSFPGQLSGTVSFYPAVGSEIFVREVLVAGAVDPGAAVTGPSGEAR